MQDDDLQEEISIFLDVLKSEDITRTDDISTMVDMYLISNEVKSDVDDFRKGITKTITDEVKEGKLSGEFGEINVIQTTKETLENQNLAIQRLKEDGLEDMTKIMSIDDKKLKEECERRGIDTDEFFVESTYSYARKRSFNWPQG